MTYFLNTPWVDTTKDVPWNSTFNNKCSSLAWWMLFWCSSYSWNTAPFLIVNNFILESTNCICYLIITELGHFICIGGKSDRLSLTPSKLYQRLDNWTFIQAEQSSDVLTTISLIVHFFRFLNFLQNALVNINLGKVRIVSVKRFLPSINCVHNTYSSEDLSMHHCNFP